MKTAIETIDPKRAKEYLKLNTQNRRVRQGWVDRLAGMLLRDEWKLTHQGIGFAKDGRLIDGQHRLLAIIQASKPAQMLVAREIDEDAYRHIDGGQPRSVADRQRFVSDPNLNRKIAALVSTRAKVLSPGKNPTIDQLDDEFLAFDEAYTAVGKHWMHSVARVTRADVGAALVSYAAHDKKKADLFARQLVSGADLYEGHAVLLLREALTSGRCGQGHGLFYNYFKCISAMRLHLGDKPGRAVLPATEDFQGNEYRTLLYEQIKRSEKGAETRTSNKATATKAKSA